MKFSIRHKHLLFFFFYHRFFQNLFFLLILSIFGAIAVAQHPAAAPPNVDADESGVPILIKHLPDWEKTQKTAIVTANLRDLQKVAGNSSILEGIDFPAGTEAVTAVYDRARLVIIEYPTPQIAIESDAQIQNKLNSSPNIFYRKIGNYAVFVFDAPDEATANSLLDKINYEKTVQWLSSNPNIVARAKQKERQELMTAGDIIVTVVKTAGIALLAAIGLGGLSGALVFYWRRREQAAANSFSDAGGMLRLNLDEMTPQTDSHLFLKE